MRLYALDALRGIAACGVAFAFHAQFAFADGVLPTGWGGPTVEWLRSDGWTFVDLFFVLSGYVFAHVYLADDGAPRLGSLRTFFVARVARLYPLHILTMLLFVPASLDHPLAIALHIAMLQVFAEPITHTLNGPAWSLSVEAFCYAIFAVACVGGRRTLRWTTAAAIALGFGYLSTVGADDPWSAPELLARGFLGFFLGQTLWRYRGSFAAVPVWMLVGGALGGVLIDAGPWRANLPLMMLTWPAVVLLAMRLGAAGSRPLLWLGERSYGIYLLHIPMLLVVGSVLGPIGAIDGAGIATMAMFVVAVLLLSDLSFRFFEQPLQRLIRMHAGGFHGRGEHTLGRKVVATP